MAFDITQEADYVAGTTRRPLKDVVVETQVFQEFTMQEGIKNSEKAIDITEGSTVFRGADNTKADRFDGGVKVLDVDVSVVPMGISEKYAKYVLDKKVAGLALKRGSSPEDMPFSDIIVGLKGVAISDRIESQVFVGDSSNANECDGLLKKMNASSTIKITGVVPVALTEANALSKVNGILSKVKSELPKFNKTEMILAMSPENFDVWYRTKFGLNGVITTQNLNTGKPVMSAYIPGTMIRVIGFYGLAGQNEMFVTRPENIIVGTDLKSEDGQDGINFRFSTDSNSWLLDADWKLGTAIVREEEVLYTKAS